MSSELPNSHLGHAKRDGMLTHTPEIKVSSKEVTAATNAPRPRASGPALPSAFLLTPKEAALYLRLSLSWLAKSRMKGDGPRYIFVDQRAVMMTSIGYAQGSAELNLGIGPVVAIDMAVR